MVLRWRATRARALLKQDLYRAHQLYKSVLKFLFLLTMFCQVPFVLVVAVRPDSILVN